MGRLAERLRRLAPRLSATERAALEAGTVWIEGDLFSGRPDFARLAAEPWPQLTAEEEAFLAGAVEEVCERVDPWRAHRERELPAEVWTLLRRHRFFGLGLPKEHGGLGFSPLAVSAIVGKLTSRSLPLGVVVLIPNSVGPGELLLHYGTPEQQSYYLPRLASGEEMPCFALTELEAGSDAAALRARGRVSRGEDGAPWLTLDFEKRYITLAPVATLIGLAVKLDDPAELLGRGRRPGITVVLLPAATPGVEIGRRHDPLGLGFPNGPLAGRGVRVPASQILGGAAGAGRGWRMLMEALAGGRAISLPAQAAGGAKLAARVAGAYAAIREQFGQPIGRLEGVEEPLARLAGTAYLLDAARVATAGAVARGAKPAVASAIVKVQATERARRSAHDAVDVAGGAGLCLGPRNLLGLGAIGASIGITVEGANILTRSLIVFGQGALRCHPYLMKELRALEEGRVGALLAALVGHAVHLAGNLSRFAWASATTSGAALEAPEGARRAERCLARAAAAFALFADLALLALGPELKRREKLSGRLADALGALLLAACALRRFAADGRPEEDRPLLAWALETLLAESQQAFTGLAANLPSGLAGAGARLVAAALRARPLGRGPSDALGSAVAQLLQRPGAARERLCSGLFLSEREGEPTERLERAFRLAVEARPLRARLRDQAAPAGEGESADPIAAAVAAGALTPAEAGLLRDAEAARRDALAVDSFGLAEILSGATTTDLPTADAAELSGLRA